MIFRSLKHVAISENTIKSEAVREQITLMEQVMHDMAAEYDSVETLDYQDWGQEADFWNATHLNTDGAARLTRALRAYIR